MTAGTTGRSGGPLLLVTGATGYIGGRLLRALRDRGERVRCMARRPDEVRARVGDTVEVVRGDVLDPESLRSALIGVHTAYYLIHAMATPRDFAKEECEGARNFARAAREAGVQRIIYLGGLGTDQGLSPHLASRHEVGRLLRETGVHTIELRSAVILGSGSLSFELVRALVERLPVLITPRWVSQRTQPIAIADVISYLMAAAELPLRESVVVEIGGRDRVSYLDVMREYAAQRGLRRTFIRVPLLTPWLSARWLGLVTPVYARVGRKLIDSVRHETIVTSPRAME
ncbi:MAG TPA: NAD(P)H-binding protein, partial [Gemmatimonadaceae bacterium]|nr:NAD(P)H-binding protein [Gemmatimonadaceae bacterium]